MHNHRNGNNQQANPATPMKSAMALLILIGTTSSLKAGEEKILPLTAHDHHALEKALGPNILKQAIPAPTITHAADYLRLSPHTSTFNLRNDGKPEGQQIQSISKTPNGWQLAHGHEQYFIAETADGSFHLTGTHDLEAGALTLYGPEEPLLYSNFAPGESRHVTMGIKVYDEDDPKDLRHQGTLEMTIHYLGAYRLSLPAGTYDTILTKSSFHGHVGPARLEDTQYRFFAKGQGLVAATEHRHLSALLFYHSNLDIARLLAQP